MERTLDNNKLILKLYEENIIVNLVRKITSTMNTWLFPCDVIYFRKKNKNINKAENAIKFFLTSILISILNYAVREVVIESLSKRRFCQHGRQPEVNRAVMDGE